ncbi:MAG: phytanoyl-CoA dioxygenase, partial [Calditrichaeota bacterium]
MSLILRISLILQTEDKSTGEKGVVSEKLTRELEQPYPLDEENIRYFRQAGFVKLKNVVPPKALEVYGAAIGELVEALNPMRGIPLEQRTTYKKAFIQITNLWQKSERVREFVFSRRLARIAAELMGTRGVRLYHDQALFKEPSGGFTPWHADQYYWPLASEKCCTVWIPLQATPLEMGPLAFAAASQHFEYGRDLEISEKSEALI